MKTEQLIDCEGITLESNKPFAFSCCDCGLTHHMVIVSEDGKPVGFAVKRVAATPPGGAGGSVGAMKLALAYVRWQAFGECRTAGHDGPPPTAAETDAALVAAITQPVVQPALSMSMFANKADYEAAIAQPVQPAKPLTLAQIDLEVRNAHIAYALDKFSSFEVALTRKVEAAHGITVPAPRNDAATGQIKKEGES